MILERIVLFPFYLIYLLIGAVILITVYGLGWVITGERAHITGQYPRMR